MSVLLADELPQDAAGAELVLGSHVEHKGEIDAREASFLSFKSKGEELIAAGHYAKNEVCGCVFFWEDYSQREK